MAGPGAAAGLVTAGIGAVTAAADGAAITTSTTMNKSAGYNYGEKKVNPKREAREAAKEKRAQQPGYENVQKIMPRK